MVLSIIERIDTYLYTGLSFSMIEIDRVLKYTDGSKATGYDGYAALSASIKKTNIHR